MSSSESSIFERLGGAPAIDAAVDAFYVRVLADESVASFFEGVSMPRQIKQQKAFFTTALGGPAIYKGRDMKAAHDHLAIQEKHFNSIAQHLIATLQSLGVAQELIDEVIAAISPLASDIINTPTTD